MRESNRDSRCIAADAEIMKRLFVSVVLFMPRVEPVGLNNDEWRTLVDIVPLRRFLPIQGKQRLVGPGWKIVICFRTHRTTKLSVAISALDQLVYSPRDVRGQVGQGKKTLGLCHD